MQENPRKRGASEGGECTEIMKVTYSTMSSLLSMTRAGSTVSPRGDLSCVLCDNWKGYIRGALVVDVLRSHCRHFSEASRPWAKVTL